MIDTKEAAHTVGDHVICGCRCHAGQEGIVTAVSADGGVISITTPYDDIALPAKDVTTAEIR